MGTDVKVGSFTKNTGGVDDETNTVNGLGFTPKGLELQCVQSTSDKTFSDNACFARGFSDGTNHRSVWNGSEDNLFTTDEYRFQNDTKVICLRNPTTGVLIAEGTVAFSSGQFVITWTKASTDAYIINYIVYGGTDLTIKVGEFAQHNVNESKHENLQGDSNFIQFMGIQTPTENLVVAAANSNHGCAADDGLGVITEGSIFNYSVDNVGTTQTRRALSSSHCIIIGSTGYVGRATLTSFDGTGINLTWTNTDGVARKIYYMAFKGGDFEVGVSTTQTANDTNRTITTAFKAAAVMLLSDNSASDNPATPTVESRAAMGFSDGTNDHSIWFGNKDNVGTSESKKRTSNTNPLVTAIETTPAILDSADTVTFNATPNMVIHFDIADGTARNFIWAIVKETAVGPIIRNIADSLSLGGGIVSRKLIARRTILEGIGGYESEGFEDEGYETGTGGISLTGNVFSKIVIPRSIADVLSPLTGTVSRILHAVRSISDNLPLTDNVIANLTGVTRSISDSLSPLTGIVNRKLLANRSLSDSLTPLTGVVTAATVIVRNMADSLSPLTGTVAVLQTFGRSISDSISPFIGVVSRTLHAKRNVTGNLTFSDIVTGITAQIADLVDSISSLSGVVSVKATFRRTINESISLLSSVLATINHFTSIVDSLTLSGVVTALTVLVRNLSDSIGLTGVVNRTLHAIRNITESISLSSILSALIVSTTSTRKVIGSFHANNSIKKGLKSFLDIKKGLKS